MAALISIEQELQTANFGDERLNKRFKKMVTDFVDNPGKSVPEACKDWAATKGAYGFWNSEHVDTDNIIHPHRQSVLERIAEHPLVLLVQDTTEINYTHLKATTGLGYLEAEYQRGFKLHTTLAISPEPVPLGILHQKYWIRPPDEYGKREDRRQKSIEEKESYRWIEAMNAAAEMIPSTTQALVICDREGDIFEMFANPRPAHFDLLIRAAQNRRIKEEAGYLFEAARQALVIGEMTVEINRGDDHPARTARLQLRATPLTLLPPANRPQKNHREGIPLHLVVAEEINPPIGVDPVYWVLLTTLPVVTIDDARRMVQYYILSQGTIFHFAPP